MRNWGAIAVGAASGLAAGGRGSLVGRFPALHAGRMMSAAKMVQQRGAHDDGRSASARSAEIAGLSQEQMSKLLKSVRARYSGNKTKLSARINSIITGDSGMSLEDRFDASGLLKKDANGDFEGALAKARAELTESISASLSQNRDQGAGQGVMRKVLADARTVVVDEPSATGVRMEQEGGAKEVGLNLEELMSVLPHTPAASASFGGLSKIRHMPEDDDSLWLGGADDNFEVLQVGDGQRQSRAAIARSFADSDRDKFPKHNAKHAATPKQRRSEGGKSSIPADKVTTDVLRAEPSTRHRIVRSILQAQARSLYK